MGMQKLLTVTLDAKQVRQACEAFVAEKMNDQHQVNMAFEASHSDTKDGSVDVVVTKKRVRAKRNSKKADTRTLPARNELERESARRNGE